MIRINTFHMSNQELIDILSKKFNIEIYSIEWRNGNIVGEYR